MYYACVQIEISYVNGHLLFAYHHAVSCISVGLVSGSIYVCHMYRIIILLCLVKYSAWSLPVLSFVKGVA